MVNRVHRHTAHLRPATEPPAAPSLTQRNIAMLDVANLPDRRIAVDVNSAYLTARQSQLSPIAFLGDKLRRAARSSHHLRAFTRTKFDVVNRRAQRNGLQRKGIAGNDVCLRSRHDCLPHFQAYRRDDVPLLAVKIVKQRDQRRAIRIVLDGCDLRRYALLVALEVYDPVEPLCATAPTAHGNVAIVVAAGYSLLRLQQRLVRSISRYLIMGEVRLKAPR